MAKRKGKRRYRPSGPAAKPAAPPPPAVTRVAEEALSPPTAAIDIPLSPGQLKALGVTVIGVLIGVCYYPALFGDFVWDDLIFSEEPVIHAWSGLKSIWLSPADIGNEGHYWPIVYTTFYLEHKLWGLAPAGYHAVNTVLYFVNSLLVWRLMTRLAVPGAWLIAAVFAVHPLHVESVAWIIERKDLLSGLFYLGAVLAWLRFLETPNVARYIATLVLFVAGLLSKTVVITLPAALLVLQWWREGRLTWTDLLRVMPLLVVGFAITFADFAYYTSRESLDLGYSFAERAMIAGRALWFYAAKLVWPADLAVIHPLWQVDVADILGWLYVAAAAVLAAALWFARRWIGRGPLAGALFFVVTLSPVLGFIDYGYMQFSFVADRFQYLAGIGVIAVLIAAAVYVVDRLPNTARQAVPGLAGIVLATFGVLTWQQAGIYKDEVALFSHVVALNPVARDAHLNLGSALLQADRVEEGLAASRIAAEQRPDTPGPYASLGRGLQAQGEFEEAEQNLRRALEIDPKHLSALQNLAESYRKRGLGEQAVEVYARVLAIDADYALAYAGLGHTLFTLGRYQEALQSMGRALEIYPELSMAGALYLHMGRAALELESFDVAEVHFTRALRMLVDSVEPLLGLANLRARQGRPEDAESYRRQARELFGGNPEALHNVAESLRKEGRLDEAITTYLEVIEIDPESAPGHAGLGIAYYQAENYQVAIDTMTRALELDAELTVAPTLQLFIGHSMGALGRGEEADAQYKLALELDPRNADALDHLAMSRFAQQRFEEALELYRTLADVQPDNASTHSNLGAVLHHLGRNEEAMESIERALAIDPDHELATVGRREIQKALDP